MIIQNSNWYLLFCKRKLNITKCIYNFLLHYFLCVFTYNFLIIYIYNLNNQISFLKFWMVPHLSWLASWTMAWLDLVASIIYESWGKIPYWFMFHACAFVPNHSSLISHFHQQLTYRILNIMCLVLLIS